MGGRASRGKRPHFACRLVRGRDKGALNEARARRSKAMTAAVRQTKVGRRGVRRARNRACTSLTGPARRHLLAQCRNPLAVLVVVIFAAGKPLAENVFWSRASHLPRWTFARVNVTSALGGRCRDPSSRSARHTTATAAPSPTRCADRDPLRLTCRRSRGERGAMIAIDVAVRPHLVQGAIAHEGPWRMTRRIPTGSQVANVRENGIAAWHAVDTAIPLKLCCVLADSYRDGGSAWDAFS